MTAVDKYANADLENGKLAQAAKCQGNKTVTIVTSFEVAADDSANSVYRVFPDVNPCLIPVDIKIYNDAMGGAESDIDFGIYEGCKGGAIDADALVDGLSLKTAHGANAPLCGLTAVDVADLGKQVFELAGHTIANRKDTYDLALTVNTATGAAGTVTVIGTFVQG